MEGRLDMATRKRLTNRFKSEYAKASKKQKGEILDRLVAVGMGRSTARRLLKEPVAAVPRASSGREDARSTRSRRRRRWNACGCRWVCRAART